MVSNQPAECEDAWDYRSEGERISRIEDLDECLDAYRDYFTRMLVLRFGKEILELSADDQRLMAHMKSGETERQRMALASLLELRFVFHTELIDMCTQYVEFGADVHISGDCISYLALATTRNCDDRIPGRLQDCAKRLSTSGDGKDDEVVIALIDFSLRRRGQP